MRRLLIILVAFQVTMAAPLMAVSYPPSVQEPTYLKDDAVLRVGARVHLFHSGTPDVRSLIKVGNVLTVYHEYPPDLWTQTSQTGKIKVTGTIGDYYFDGEIIEGLAQPGNLAIKDNAACLITTRIKER
ncbi:hypothetical protein L4X63_20240 [Geomonas sp. Red32]|uniref:hypothetical protein n=1 Tax=Geomonas sp. Red32 TaxID=2912856 RepID=UPI00202D0BF3|nr:hypothetical protein [Geomonas sp. Red32]MCM0083916.1 hypothetical protein [Geomonas sp. Red32]